MIEGLFDRQHRKEQCKYLDVPNGTAWKSSYCLLVQISDVVPLSL